MVRRGFTIPDAAVGSVGIALLVLLLVPMMSRQREVGTLEESRSNLRRIAGSTFSYANDSADQYFGYTWVPGQTSSQWPDLHHPTDHWEAHRFQATDIIRRRHDPSFTIWKHAGVDLLLPFLPLADYLGLELPDRLFASPADATTLGWQDDPLKLPFAEPEYQFYRMRSSYEVPPAFYSVSPLDQPPGWLSPPISQGPLHYHYFFAGLTTYPLGPRSLNEVKHPSLKAFVYDSFQRHYGPREVFFAFPEARVLMLLADGSADVRKTSTSNRGWNPTNKFSPSAMAFSYEPRDWEPPIPPGQNGKVFGHYRWTRANLAGRDFGGADIQW